MTEITRKIGSFWQDSVNLLFGLWLIASPWALGFLNETAASWNMWIVGAIIAITAFAAMVAFHSWEEWVNIALGAWLVISPWVLGFASVEYAMWNSLIVGVWVGVFAFWSAVTEHDRKGLFSHS